MLSWLSGESQPLAALDADPPETPAHTFVTRAFKQAIFGTPAQPQPQSQRAHRTRTQSMDERRQQHHQISKTRASAPARPADHRARSNSMDDSPAKPPGILLTPGTGTNRRKSVSWEPRDAKRLAIERENNLQGDSGTGQPKGLKPDDFTSRLRGSYQPPPAAQHTLKDDAGDADETMDMDRPRSTSGRYWKDKFVALDKTSSHDMRKLKKKEEVAKKFGQSRDNEAQQLEARLAELQQQMHARKADAPRRRTKDEIARGARADSQELPNGEELEKARARAQTLEDSLTEQRKVATAHLKSKESEIARLRKALQDSEDARKKAEEELAEQRRVSTTHLRAKERELARLQREIQSLRRDDHAAEPLSVAAGTAKTDDVLADLAKRSAVASGDPASDIWADVGGADKLPPATRSPRRQRPISQPNPGNADYDAMRQGSPSRVARRLEAKERERAPLAHRTTTSLNAEAKTAPADTPRTKAKSEQERREAARQRLDERRRNREAQDAAQGTASNGVLGWE